MVLAYTSVLFLIGCSIGTLSTSREVQPRNFTAVEGYNTTLKFSIDGCYLFLYMWVLFPHTRTPVLVLLDDPIFWPNHQLACSDGTKLIDCREFEFIIYASPHINESGTAFSFSRKFTNEGTVWMSK